jgi:hypothetical protein
MTAVEVLLLETLLTVASADRLTFRGTERSTFSAALHTLEERRYRLEDSAVCDRIASLQAVHGVPISG